jgi:hypothetical protein
MEHNQLDVSTKELIWDGPADWLRRYGIDTAGGLEVVDSDASTLTAAADKVIKVKGEQPFLVDLEPHSYHDIDVVRKLWLRQAALDHRHNLPVLTVLILLHKRANSPGLSGVYERRLPEGRSRIGIIIVWCGSGRRTRRTTSTRGSRWCRWRR